MKPIECSFDIQAWPTSAPLVGGLIAAGLTLVVWRFAKLRSAAISPTEAPKWTDALSVGLGLAAMIIAIASYKAAADQSVVAAKSLKLACDEARSSADDTRKALETAWNAASAAGRSADAAESLSKIGQQSVEIARANQLINEGLLAANVAGDVHIKEPRLIGFDGYSETLRGVVTVENVGKTTIIGAKVAVNIDVMKFRDTKGIYKNIRKLEITETIPLEGVEPQGATSALILDRETYAHIAHAEAAVVLAATVRWRDPGGKNWHQRSRCWQFVGSPDRMQNLACPGLDEY